MNMSTTPPEDAPASAPLLLSRYQSETSWQRGYSRVLDMEAPDGQYIVCLCTSKDKADYIARLLNADTK